MGKSQEGVAHLTAKQEKFINCLVEGKSQREAYKECYDTSRMKDKTIDEVANKLFKDHKITTRYKQLMDECAKKSIMKGEDVIRQYELIASSSVFDYINVDVEDECLYKISLRNDIDKEKARAIKKISFDRNGNVIVELWDKNNALDKLSQILNVVDQDVDKPTININMGSSDKYIV